MSIRRLWSDKSVRWGGPRRTGAGAAVAAVAGAGAAAAAAAAAAWLVASAAAVCTSDILIFKQGARSQVEIV